VEEPKLRWGIDFRKHWGGISLGINFAVEDVNGKKAPYLWIGLFTYNLYIGRLW